MIKNDPELYSEDKRKALEKAATLGINPDEPGMMSALRGTGSVDGGIPVFDLFDDHLIRTIDCLVERVNYVQRAIDEYEELIATRDPDAGAEAVFRPLINDCKADIEGMKPVIDQLSHTMITYHAFIDKKRHREASRLATS